MTECGDNLLLGKAPELDHIKPHTQDYLRYLSEITRYIPYHSNTIPMEYCIKEVELFREATSSGP